MENVLADLPEWAKVAGYIGVPAFILVLFMALGYRIVMRLGERLVNAIIEFLKQLIGKLDGFGIRLEGIGQTLQSLQEALHRSNEEHEERFQGIEGQLQQINKNLEKP